MFQVKKMETSAENVETCWNMCRLLCFPLLSVSLFCLLYKGWEVFVFFVNDGFAVLSSSSSSFVSNSLSYISTSQYVHSWKFPYYHLWSHISLRWWRLLSSTSRNIILSTCKCFCRTIPLHPSTYITLHYGRSTTIRISFLSTAYPSQDILNNVHVFYWLSLRTPWILC